MRILITGGAGYVGSVLTNQLLENGHDVIVYDNYTYGTKLNRHPNLEQINGDIRDRISLIKACKDIDSLIHLACLSNDPSCDLDPVITKKINYDAFFNVLETVRLMDIERFIHASSASVYGIHNTKVNEESECRPITDYGKWKVECEKLLKDSYEVNGIPYVAIRPGTVCGYSPRMRFDLTVNLFTAQALINKKLTVFGGSQIRPIINMKDIVNLYSYLLEDSSGDGNVYNAAYLSLSVKDIAEGVANQIKGTEISYTDVYDERSYNITSEKLLTTYRNFKFNYGYKTAIESIQDAYKKGYISNLLDDELYYNVKYLNKHGLK